MASSSSCKSSSFLFFAKKTSRKLWTKLARLEEVVGGPQCNAMFILQKTNETSFIILSFWVQIYQPRIYYLFPQWENCEKWWQTRPFQRPLNLQFCSSKSELSQLSFFCSTESQITVGFVAFRTRYEKTLPLPYSTLRAPSYSETTVVVK
jgi:hypothetical protein